MKVRLRKAATVYVNPVIGHHWYGAGAQIEIPGTQFDEELHEAIQPEPKPEPEPQPLPQKDDPT